MHVFSESVKSKLGESMKGHDIVNEELMEWENIVNRVAKSEVGLFVVEWLDGGIMKLRKKLV